MGFTYVPLSCHPVLGHFSYNENQNGWALECGMHIARYEDSDYYDEFLQLESLQFINAMTASGGAKCKLALATASRCHQTQAKSFIRDILSTLYISPHSIAAFIVGMASHYLFMAKSSAKNPVRNEKDLIATARARIDLISDYCPILQINDNALFAAMMATDCKSTSIRSLLVSPQ